jgi:hypothetical protein
MNRHIHNNTEDAIPVGSQKGFIAFCETNLRYEKGLKAWIILGPYLLGAFVLERLANTSGDTFATKFAWWSGFLAYLIIFPDAWRRLLRYRSSRKVSSGQSASPKI